MQRRNDRQTLCSVSRRGVILLLPLALAACATRRPEPAPLPAASPFSPRYGALDDGGFHVPGVPAGEMKDRNRRTLVVDPTGQPAGTLVVDPENRFLYLVQENGKALRYGVGVGREGLQFSGTAEVAHKRAWPRWTPTPSMITREPEKYEKWAGGMAGGESNPLGARALYLFKDGKDTLYRIHGTNEPWSIGEAVSSGCIRMMNQDVIDLSQRIPDGTKVVVLPAN
ncbi:L,D-transpeptidase [Ancylobacter sp. SL191]|uniref:L,D-transpeptidase n=1 Tax=Ancylobacter sp. SL191 TaxID=2995166 RepID=UPI00226E9738|nr:L,D-transpeptidase [Ancylobacter sp. SL191]WAC27724.1 L,D-transpeptidase [Ancylobacter sp. SL191]